MSGSTPSTILAGTAEPLLIAVIGLLALVILGLAVLALLVRRRNRVQAAAAPVLTRAPTAVPVAASLPAAASSTPGPARS